ncbi:PglL family O-oligosaccharyltransferase [Neisseria polysaccharea]|uniref:PglL family O-oligosaccharyltransferase n=1 Tax=Neisseria polysaccharea TaxID=489 RepID=UPI00046E294C
MSAETPSSDPHPVGRVPVCLLLCFLWINIAPFISTLRVGPASGFYLEAASATGLIVLLFLTARHKLFDTKIPAVGFLLLAMAAFWWLQARLMNLIYTGMNDIVSWIFVLLAISAWACKGLTARFGQERIVTLFAWSLFIGALLQSCVAIMQFVGWSDISLFRGIIAYSGGNVNGQLGQRNHLGHYLMWGILSAAYLHSQRKIPAPYGAICLLMLTSVLGLVNSRTILGYIAAIVLILPCWYFHSGKSSRRIVLSIAAAAALAALFQFSMNTILETFTHIRYETAVERVGNSSFSGSLRQIEWNKAIVAFQSAPLFGHGWNSFAQQTFLLNAEQHNLSNNILNVLFTHSHNIILQLLAETGISGTLLVAVTLMTGIAGLLKRSGTPASLFLLCTLAVSMCHSMLEYPLWYVYFLIPFSLMIFLSEPGTSDGISCTATANRSIQAASLILLAGLLHLGWTYTQLVRFSTIRQSDNTQTVQKKIDGLRHISESSPMLSYYADLSLSKRASPTDTEIHPWAEKATLKALTYRPYSNTYQVALYLMRQGKTEEARQWMQATQSYYPYLMPFYAGKIRQHPALAPLLPDLLKDCKIFVNTPQHQKAQSCD